MLPPPSTVTFLLERKYELCLCWGKVWAKPTISLCIYCPT